MATCLGYLTICDADGYVRKDMIAMSLTLDKKGNFGTPNP